MSAINHSIKQKIKRRVSALLCQCCGLGFAPKARGTNRDQSKNSDFCIECFKNGEFQNPGLTIQSMEKRLLNMARRNDGLCLEEAQAAIQRLPDLKRWRMTHIL